MRRIIDMIYCENSEPDELGRIFVRTYLKVQKIKPEQRGEFFIGGSIYKLHDGNEKTIKHDYSTVLNVGEHLSLNKDDIKNKTDDYIINVGYNLI